MLRIMRKYQKGVLGILAILFVSMAMAGFGIDMFLTGGERHAITVNDDTVAYTDYYRELRQTRDRYVQMFGARFNELAKSFNLNLPKQVVDQMINGLLIEQKARSIGLTAGNEELKSFLNKSFNGDTAQYVNFLRTSGYTAPQFEAKARTELLREQFSSLLKLASFSSKKEAEALLTKEETSVDVSYVEVRGADAIKQLPAPDEATLKAYFESNMTDFQTPPSVSYQYVEISPAAVAQDVILTDEDIAFYLSENEAQFSTPARAKIRHIEILFPKNATEAQQTETRQKAEGVLKRAQANEPFDALVMEMSDDITTKMIGGDVGWIDSKSVANEVAAKVFALKATGIADLVATSSGFKIVKVDEYQASKVKELSEVRGEIEKTLRAQEAPAYAVARAQELFGDLKNGKTTLGDIAIKYKIAVGKTDGALAAAKDPTVELKGLTAAIIEQGEQSPQLHEIVDRAVLVMIEKYNEPTLPSFETVKEQVVADVRKKDASHAAEKFARELLLKVQGGEELRKAAEVMKLKVESKEKVTRKGIDGGVLSDPRLIKDLFNDPKVGKSLADSYRTADGFVVVTVTKVNPPSADDLKSKLASFQEQASTSVSTALTTSLINHLKTVGKVDFDQSILVE